MAFKAKQRVPKVVKNQT